MKKIITILITILTAYSAAAQRPTFIGPADTIKMYSSSTNAATLQVLNKTKDTTGGVLFNIGNGVTIFKRLLVKLTDSTYLIGNDTLKIKPGGGSTDTTSLSNRINQKQNLNDTTTYDATKHDIDAALNANRIKLRYGGMLGQSLIVVNGDTVTFKNLLATGCLSITSLSDSTMGFTIDTACLSLKYLRITDTANLRPRLIAGTNVTITGTYPNLTISSSGAGSQTPLTNHVNGAGYNINNLSGLEVKRVTGGGTTTENKILYSEQQDNVDWDLSSIVITPDAETDLEGNTTMELATISNPGGNRLRSSAVTVTPSTTYTFSFDVKRGTATDLYYSVYDVTNGADIISPTNYYSSTSGTVSRVSFTVNIPASCTQAYFYPIRDNISTGTAYVGRVQVASPGNAYIETTGTPAAPSGGGGVVTNQVIKTDSSGRVHVGDSAMAYKLNVNGSMGVKLPRGVLQTNELANTTLFAYDDISGSNFATSANDTASEHYLHAPSATDILISANNTRSLIDMGTPDDELRIRLSGDTNRISLTQKNGDTRGAGSLKLQWPLTQTIWNNNYILDLPAKSGTLATTGDVVNLGNSDLTLPIAITREIDGNVSILNWNNFDNYNIKARGVSLLGQTTSSVTRGEFIVQGDSILLKPFLGSLFIYSLLQSPSSTDSVLVKSSDGKIKTRAQSDIAGGGGSMVYPGAGIPVSTGSAWSTSITDNSTNWNTAFTWGNHALSGYLSNVTGLITQGTNITITGSGTSGSPYVINASSGGGLNYSQVKSISNK
jgi:hypothetical protein